MLSGFVDSPMLIAVSRDCRADLKSPPIQTAATPQTPLHALPMFETVCTLPLTSDLFAQAIHPTEPIVSVGLAGGHVETYRLPPVASDGSSQGDVTASENGYGHIGTAWRTRRHKGSCRTLSYSVDGSHLYSGGTDGLVKAADSMTGQVFAKIAIPLHA